MEHRYIKDDSMYVWYKHFQRCFILQMATDFFKWTDEENCTRTSKTPLTFLDEKFEDLSQKPICKQVSFSLYIKNVRNLLRFIRNSWAHSHSHQRMFMIWKGFFFKNLVFFFFSSQWAITGWLYNLCAKVGHFWELEEVLKQETAGSGAHTPFRSNSRDLKTRPHILHSPPSLPREDSPGRTALRQFLGVTSVHRGSTGPPRFLVFSRLFAWKTALVARDLEHKLGCFLLPHHKRFRFSQLEIPPTTAQILCV